ncbi:di-trans,poly-cis-decaprenylcistransferase [Candidatus Campbellbacteria bacterium CG11_big_fil_rev_8_21_14_0_20_44_21]|nr:MAG: di-trans,poly-cis-decaprenylcistransferase [Candidatus Campbellbacteria bacterium CG11_big_fil_rev_8_21_14_0_20_44_21]
MSENKKIPNCIGIIMDGNRRWAKEKGLPTLQGHKKGYEVLKKCLRFAKEKGLKWMIVYAFSTENWERSKEEVSYLMDIFRGAFKNELESLRQEKARIIFIGKKDLLPEDIQKSARKLEEDTKNETEATLVIALSYGGRSEITEAVNKAVKEGREVSEESFKDYLWTKDIPDPDLIIRTGGEKRLSNFLPWQSTYSEFFFSDTYWPDFQTEEFEKILEEYGQKNRRNGGDQSSKGLV